MFCKWCGMESMTTDQCSWCHHSLTTTAAEETPSRAESETVEEPAAPAAFAEAELELHADHEESPLAAGLVAPKDQPKPNAPTPPPPIAPLPATAAQETASRPAIGVRRPGGARTIPAVPPPRASAAGGNRAGSHTPPPAMPMPSRSSASVSRQTVPAASANTATAPTMTVRPPEVSGNKTGRLVVPSALLGGAKAAIPETVSAPALHTASSARVGQPIVEGEAGGLADGFSAPSRTSETANVPQLGTFTPAKSKYYSGQVLDPVSGTHYDADTGKPITATSAETTTAGKTDKVVLHWDAPEKEHSMAAVVGKFLGIFGVILIVGAIFAALAPAGMLAPLLIANFAGGLLLPVLGVVPWQDEDSDDAMLMFVLMLLFGPVVAFFIYGVLTMVRQTGNAAVVGVLAVAALSNVVIRFAAHDLHRFSDLMPFQSGSYSVSLMFLSWAGLLAMAGWFFANVFHKFDE